MLDDILQGEALPGDQDGNEGGQGVVERQVTHLEGQTLHGLAQHCTHPATSTEEFIHRINSKTFTRKHLSLLYLLMHFPNILWQILTGLN